MLNKKKLSKFEKSTNRNRNILTIYIVLVYLVVYLIYNLCSEPTTIVVTIALLPIILSLTNKMIDCCLDYTDILFIAKRNQELYNLGIIDKEKYLNNLEELKEEYNKASNREKK